MGGVCHCQCRNWSILAALSAGKVGAQIEEPWTGQPCRFASSAHASATHWAVVTRPGDVGRLPTSSERCGRFARMDGDVASKQ